MFDPAPLTRKKLKVTGIVQESSDTRSLILQPVNGPIAYQAGQFLTFVTRAATGREIRRSYSISSSPELGEPLTITVKRIPNGEFSRILFDKTSIGDELETIGASGFFVLPENIDNYRTIIFFAAGSGITPVYSLLKSLLHKHPSVKAILVYSNRSTSDTIFYDGLQELQENFSRNFVLQFMFSSSADLSKSRLTPASLESFLNRFHIKYDETLFYVCGPGEYMRMINFTLLTLGVHPKRIKREIFYIEQPAVTPAPNDTRPHTVKLISGGKSAEFVVQYPVTILQSAKLLNIPIPFSCETGQCGTCVAKCLQGEVWMARNEVLLDDEISSGYILTCTGYPVHGDVTLTI